jgi:hypothetical protein
MVKFPTGCLLDENHYQEVSLLCQHFGLHLPVVYEGFTGVII